MIELYTDASLRITGETAKYDYKAGLSIVKDNDIYSYALKGDCKNISASVLELLAIYVAQKVFEDEEIILHTDNKNCVTKINTNSVLPDIFGLDKASATLNPYHYKSSENYRVLQELSKHKASDHPAKNQNPWFATYMLRDLRRKDNLTVKHVKGHAGNKQNIKADKASKLAVNYINTVRQGYTYRSGKNGVDTYIKLSHIHEKFLDSPPPKLFFYDSPLECFLDHCDN